MYRKIVLLCIALLICALPVSAADISIVLDGTAISLVNKAVTVNYRTMVPLREVFEKLGAKVNYDEATENITAVKGARDVTMTIGSDSALVNGQTVKLDYPVIYIDGSTYVPIRFVGEALRYDVTWDENTRTVHLKGNGVTLADFDSVGGGGQTSTVVISSGPARTEEISVTADTHVRTGATENDNFGSNKILEIKGTADKDFVRYIYMKFDLSKLSDAGAAEAKLRLFNNLMEKEGSKITIDAYEVSDNAWEEGKITAKNAPSAGEKVGSAQVSKQKDWFEIDISDYVRKKIASDKMVNIVLKGVEKENLKAEFESKEGTNKPILQVKYGGGGTATVSQPTVTGSGTEVACAEDTFLKTGSSNDKNFGSENKLEFKNTKDVDLNRKILLKFNITGVSAVNSAKIRLYCVNMQTATKPTTVEAFAVGSNWQEKTVTAKSAPTLGEKIGTAKCEKINDWFEIDITEYVKQKANDDKIVSVLLSGLLSEDLRLDFESREGAHAPVLLIQ